MAKRNKNEARRQKPAYQREQQVNIYHLPTTFHVLPKNWKQELLIAAIKSNVMVATHGCAGTGKTYCGVGTAAQLFMKGKYKKVVLTRAYVHVGKTLGMKPGDITAKMTPMLMPMLEVLKKAFGKGKYEYLISKEQIELQPLEDVRGRSYEDALILVDEAQNLTMEELKALSTRIGENSKMIFMGDPAQSDLRKDGSDFKRFCELCEKNGVPLPVIEFGVEDIVRSDIVADLVKMFMKEGL